MSEAGLGRGISDERVKIQFDVDEPVDLLEVTAAFGAFSRQYQKVLRRFNGGLGEEEVRLYLTKIETNCIVAEMGALAETGLATINVMDWHNIFVEFVRHLNTYIRLFARTPVEPEAVGDATASTAPLVAPTRPDLEDFQALLEVVASKRTGHLRLEVKQDANGDGSLVYTYDSATMKEAYNNVTASLADLDKTAAAQHEKVLLWLPQLNFAEHKSAGRSADKGIIESICARPLQVFWISDLDSKRVKSQEGNPSKVSYIVDVNVETKKGAPKAYRVVKLHDIVEDEPDSELPVGEPRVKS